MTTNDNRQNAHDMIDHIFHNLLPARGMAERPEQVALSHLMLDALLDGSIALCDAGTGIGKTYAYLAAGAVCHRFRTASGQPVKPILISTSSIALLSLRDRLDLDGVSHLSNWTPAGDTPWCCLPSKRHVCYQGTAGRDEPALGSVTLGRSAVHTTQQFKASPGSVLLATSSLEDVVEFICHVKSSEYFHHEKPSDV